tara:strand:+ start:913 stop:1134 length:222 start_codon:yes stop_codon:yes gene_type:complete
VFTNLYLRDISAKVRTALRGLVHGERGLETVEWALLIVVIALVVIVAAGTLGERITEIFNEMVTALTPPGGAP